VRTVRRAVARFPSAVAVAVDGADVVEAIITDIKVVVVVMVVAVC